MILPTSLTLLLLVALVSSQNIEDDSNTEAENDEEDMFESNDYSVRELYSNEAKKVMVKLQEEADDVEDKIDEFTNEFEADNDLSTVLHEYRKAYEAAKYTDCADDDPIEVKDEYLITDFVDKCGSALPEDLMKEFANKLTAAKAKVKEIDENLEITCTSNPSSCEEAKKGASTKLNGIVTPEFDAELKKDGGALLKKFETDFTNCFKSETAGFQAKTIKATTDMKECLAKTL